MTSATLVIREVVTLSVCCEVGNRTVGPGGRVVENEPPLSTRARKRLMQLLYGLLSYRAST